MSRNDLCYRLHSGNNTFDLTDNLSGKAGLKADSYPPAPP